jgi:hypothetical protein
MNEIVDVTCRECGKTQPVNYIKGLHYGWPTCCSKRRMVVTAPVDPELILYANALATVPPEDRKDVYVDPLPDQKSGWTLKKKRIGMK